ncbi:hypothetical protein PAWBP_7700 [Paulownia witches'-broom phytoplasma]|nr:hypothetical protein PAWBP_7700 [Paulownia witches'-broom phytoplasma]
MHFLVIIIFGIKKNIKIIGVNNAKIKEKDKIITKYDFPYSNH